MQLKPLVQFMALLPLAIMPSYASDLSIYKGNQQGKTSIFLMLDTSGSMGISSLVLSRNNQYGSPGDVDSPLCDRVLVEEYYSNRSTAKMWEWAYNLKDPSTNKTAIAKSVKIGEQTIPYYVRGCSKNGVTQYDRLSRLKEAILPLLASDKLDNSVVMGLGHFSAKTPLNIGTATNQLVDGHSGRVLVPAAPLSLEQRQKIALEVANFKSLDTTTNEDGSANPNLKLSSNSYPSDVVKSSSGTPTAHAYAEAGAYMMGTGTGYDSTHNSLSKINYIYDGYMVKQSNNDDGQVYFICVELGSGRTSALGATVKQCPSGWPSYSSSNKSFSTGNKVYRPTTQGGWEAVTPKQLRDQVGDMNKLWDVYSKLPVGWRLDGWMKVDQEPMDIEPIVGTVWGYNDGVRGLVSYRTNPFALSETSTGVTDNLVGGFRYSVASAKKTDGSNTYVAGGSKNSCDGNGIYFLTDGAPNSTKDDMAKAIMNHSLTPVHAFQVKPNGTGVLVSPKLKSNLFSGETGGWEYIGEYAKKLNNQSNNPAGMRIKTAVVGFGSTFEGLKQKPDGSYDCDSTDNLDVKNACKWGSKGHGYGEGGFYQATNSDDIAASIVDFVQSLKVDFTPSSLGSIAVPRDPLDQTQLMTSGFFPMVMPQEDHTLRTWAGNLKKYHIIDGTLKDANHNAIYHIINNQQVINPNAKDLWSNDATGMDHSLVNQGGAWAKIPVPSQQVIANDPSSASAERRVFIMDENRLKRVHKDNLATAMLGESIKDLSVRQRYALLNYLGYATALPDANVTSLSAADLANITQTPSSPYRYLGGVVHSTPLLVTQQAKLDPNGNTLINARHEYVVYGSMEGGLHIVDAKTGQEKSVFVPKEIIDHQYDTLVQQHSKGIVAESKIGMAYGVDAPWTADNTFKVQVVKDASNKQSVQYQADRLNIYGGLRMGGEALYGLNIADPSQPELLFHLHPGLKEFARMGQIWSKPTVAEIRVQGERRKVLIFGGGYDAEVYEQAAADFKEPSSTATRGNALYIVDATTGELIWMTSANTADIDQAHKKTTQAQLLYSVVGQPVVRDYDADGLSDMIYFADLGGQIFRVDLNNIQQVSLTEKHNLAVRVQRIANLREASSNSEHDRLYNPSFVPRFYDRLTTAVFDAGQSRFVFISTGSGNRSFPLESSTQRNKIYGIFDYDAAMNGLEKPSFAKEVGLSVEATSANLAKRGELGRGMTSLHWGGGSLNNDKIRLNMGRGAEQYRGWVFDLNSVADTSTQKFAKSFEESQLIASDLYINLYDPKASLNNISNSCGGGVQGLSTIHRVCAPFGDCAAYVKQDYQGITGPTLGATADSNRTSSLVGPLAATEEACVGKCDQDQSALNTQRLKKYSQARVIKPTRWFER